MTFADDFRTAAGQLTAADCANAVSPLLSVRTVEDWMQARREPPAWTQAWILTRIKRARERADRKSPPRNADL